MGRTIGYARVCTPEQDLSLQLAALRQASYPDEQIFLDVASGTHTMRPGLEACLQALASGDLLVVWHLDFLGRSMLHLVTVMTELGRRQVGFRSLCDGALDTTTATWELVFHLFSALAQFERRLIQERTLAGLAAARARGKHGGRRPLRANAPQVRMAQTLNADSRVTVPEICQSLHISRATFYRYIALARQNADGRARK
jgi:DNA invertase Pin-like site-specific DNA recombinase